MTTTNEFDILAFSEGTLKATLLDEGEQVLTTAEANPPASNTAGFSAVIDVLVGWLDQKPVRQDRVFSFLILLPQFAVTAILNKLKIKVGQECKDRPRMITLERVTPLMQKLLLYYKGVIFDQPKVSEGSMTPLQIGALHNLLNVFEIVRKGDFRAILTAGENIEKAVMVRFGNVPSNFSQRLDVLDKRLKYSADQDSIQSESERQQAVPIQKSVTPAPVTTMGAALAVVLQKSATVVPVESEAEQASLMAAEMSRLNGIAPHLLQDVKNGDADPQLLNGVHAVPAGQQVM
jgi:hypothetical protein